MPDKPRVSRGYVDVGDTGEPRFIHYYTCGSGTAVLMLHRSPASAATLLPVAERVGRFATAIALDTPGYGFSDPPGFGASDLKPYVDVIERCRQQLGLDDIVIYGSATGSQLAIEYAREYPERCSSIVVDNIADFRPEERSEMLDGYFSDLKVDSSGAHLPGIWNLSLNTFRFFPWHWNQRTEARLPARDIDISLIQESALLLLLAGESYDQVYRAAFANEHAERLQTISTKATVIRSTGSIVRKYADRFDDYEWPENISFEKCGPTPDERVDAVVDAVRRRVEGLSPAAPRRPEAATGRRICTTPAGNISYSMSGLQGEDWLLLHDIGHSSLAIDHLARSIGATHRVIAMDLPGHGASDTLCTSGDDYMECCLEALNAVLDDVGIAKANVLAFGGSATIATSFAASHQQRIASNCLVDPVFDIEPIDVEPMLDGSHLISLWHALINAELYSPRDRWSADTALSGVPAIDAMSVNRALIDRLLCEPVYRQAVEAINALPVPMLENCAVSLTEGTTAADRSQRALNSAGLSPNFVDCVWETGT